jgi:hypothetical protein
MFPETLTKQPDFLSTLHSLVNVAVAIWHVIGGTDGEQIYGSIYALIRRRWGRAVNSTPWPMLQWHRHLVPFVQLAGWAQDWCGEETILLPPPGIELQTYQAVASHYTDYAISALTVHYSVL